MLQTVMENSIIEQEDAVRLWVDAPVPVSPAKGLRAERHVSRAGPLQESEPTHENGLGGIHAASAPA